MDHEQIDTHTHSVDFGERPKWLDIRKDLAKDSPRPWRQLWSTPTKPLLVTKAFNLIAQRFLNNPGKPVLHGFIVSYTNGVALWNEKVVYRSLHCRLYSSPIKTEGPILTFHFVITMVIVPSHDAACVSAKDWYNVSHFMHAKKQHSRGRPPFLLTRFHKRPISFEVFHDTTIVMPCINICKVQRFRLYLFRCLSRIHAVVLCDVLPRFESHLCPVKKLNEFRIFHIGNINVVFLMGPQINKLIRFAWFPLGKNFCCKVSLWDTDFYSCSEVELLQYFPQLFACFHRSDSKCRHAPSWRFVGGLAGRYRWGRRQPDDA